MSWFPYWSITPQPDDPTTCIQSVPRLCIGGPENAQIVETHGCVGWSTSHVWKQSGVTFMVPNGHYRLVKDVLFWVPYLALT